MCIIAYAPKNVSISDATIKIMFQHNPDGAGLMWKQNGIVEIRKGFFNVDKLIAAWHKIPVECEKAIHCRIATHGKVTVTCCHPFPVRGTTESMGYGSDHTDIAMMHNGIIALTSPPAGIRSPYSDTMMFAKEVLYSVKDSLDNEYIQEMLERAIGTSRMLIFRANSDTVRLGNWVRDGKVYFSNTSYKNYTYFYGSYRKEPAKVETPKTVQTPVTKTVETPNLCACDPYTSYGFDEDPELYDEQGNSLFADDETRFIDEQ